MVRFIFVGLVLIANSIYGEYFNISTNFQAISNDSINRLTEKELEILKEALSNEAYSYNNYSHLTNAFMKSEPFSAIADSKKYHIDLIKNFFTSYGHPFPFINDAHKTYTNESEKELFIAIIKDELNSKYFYEKYSYKIKNRNLKSAFSMMIKNSENSFKNIQIYGSIKQKK
jgi:hypothetical protein